MTTALNSALNAATDPNVRVFTNLIDFALSLVGIKGHTFLSFDAVYDMCERDSKGKLKRMNATKRGDRSTQNPFIGSGLTKFAKTTATANFDYEKKRESRGGEASESEGNWQQALVLKGKLTPLTVHKGDIVTRLKDGIDPNSSEALKIANQVAVLDADGSVQLKTDQPRLYLRYEVVREGGDDERAKRAMRSESVYLKANGEVVDKSEIVPYIREYDAKRTDETDHQTCSLDSVVEIRIGGMVWRRGDWVDVGRTIDNAKAALAAYKAFVAAQTPQTATTTV